MTNYYKVLGVKKDATQEEIKSSYKNLMKKYHPDLYQGDKTYAEKKAKEINGAYEVLSNPEARREYDLEMFPPTPTNGYYSTSNDNYSYTPPRYDAPPSDYYNQYKNKYSNYGKEYNYNDFANYHADRRYTDYHRSKTPNSNYVDQNVDDIPTKIMKAFDTFSSNKKFFAIIFIIIIYCVLFITTFGKSNNYIFSEFIKPQQNNQPSVVQDTDSNNISVDNTILKEEPNRDYNQVSREDFDIYDYTTEEDLRLIYNSYYIDKYSTYDEFLKAISDELYFYLFESKNK